MIGQSWNKRIPEWIGQQSDACRSALTKLWERRKQQIDFDRLNQILPEDIAETVRVRIEKLAHELGWEVHKVMNMINVYLPGIVDLPQSKPL